MTCTVEEREQVRRAVRAIQVCSVTVAVDMIEPAESQYNQWTLDAVLDDCDGVPPAILRELAIAGLRLRPTPSQAGYQHVAATV
jgi:hypothetical protein